MTDREKIINAIEKAKKQSKEYAQDRIIVPFKEANMILALLKEQEAKSPVVRKKNGYWDYVCPTCGSRDEELFHEWRYCPYCEQEVKWE